MPVLLFHSMETLTYHLRHQLGQSCVLRNPVVAFFARIFFGLGTSLSAKFEHSATGRCVQLCMRFRKCCSANSVQSFDEPYMFVQFLLVCVDVAVHDYFLA